jgi:hypothetical protein
LVPERHLNLLSRIEGVRPPDANNVQWDTAMRGLRTFLATGQADEALSLGWPHDELFRVSVLWGQIHLTGAGLAIGDREVINISSTEIRIKTASGSTLAFYRKPQVDYGVAHRARLKMAGEDASRKEVQLRAFEHTVNLYLNHHPGADVDTAKAAVLAAIKEAPL